MLNQLLESLPKEEQEEIKSQARQLHKLTSHMTDEMLDTWMGMVVCGMISEKNATKIDVIECAM